MRRPEFKFVIILLLALTLCTAPACAGSAERTFPAMVSPNQEFQVTVNVADYGAAGQVIEKLPAGFTFVSSYSTGKSCDCKWQQGFLPAYE